MDQSASKSNALVDKRMLQTCGDRGAATLTAQEWEAEAAE